MNFVVKNEYWDVELERALFGDLEGRTESVEYIEPGVDMFDILVTMKLFPSKGQARKNWKHTGGEIPAGFNMWTVGKLKQILAVWVPLPYNYDETLALTVWEPVGP